MAQSAPGIAVALIGFDPSLELPPDPRGRPALPIGTPVEILPHAPRAGECGHTTAYVAPTGTSSTFVGVHFAGDHPRDPSRLYFLDEVRVVAGPAAD